MTWDGLNQRIRSGRGQGHQNNYLPWLWVHRKNASKSSNQIVQRLPGYRRASHFYSVTEKIIAWLCKWLGASDVREQFPMWPFEHQHPLASLTANGIGRQIPGLMDIARSAGIRHGTEPGSRSVPYVGTTDVLLTIETYRTWPALVSVKPHGIVVNAEPTDRVLERLELERRYADAIDGHHVIADGSIVDHTLIANLETLAPYAIFKIPDDDQAEDCLGYLRSYAGRMEMSRAFQIAGQRAGVGMFRASQLFYAAAWQRRLDVDITHHLRADLPVTFGASSIVAKLQADLFGEAL